MSERSIYVTSRRAALLAVGIVAIGAFPAVGQVSIDVRVDGANTLNVDPGPVELAFDVRVTSSVDLAGIQFGLLSSSGGLFEYAANAWVTGSPWSAGEVLASGPSAGDSLVSDPLPIFGYFAMTREHSASQFPSVIATLNVRSAGSLGDGTYTFMAGDPGVGFFWTNSDGHGTFDSSSIFTLVVGTGSGGGGGGGGGGQALDTDGDGVADTDDICPGSNDSLDTDGDEVPDGCDNCPNDVNPDQEDTDGNGLGDACDEADEPVVPDDGTGDGGTDDDGTTDDGTVDDGTSDGGTDAGQDDVNVIVVPGPCGASLAELGVMSLLSLYLVQRSRRRRVI
jgi:hypothetical protein